MVIDENLIVELERRGIVTATFRKLSPAKKAAVYGAAQSELAQAVFDNVSLDRIADAAGISKGSLIQYFRHKEGLFHFVAEVYLSEYCSFLEDYFRSESAVRATERIRQFILGHLEYWEKGKGPFRYYFRLAYENDSRLTKGVLSRIRELRMQYWKGLVERGIETGQMRKDLGVSSVALALEALLSYLERLAGELPPAAKGKQYLENLTGEFVSGIWDGLKA
ncbi:MAG: TetR/AcrR family transcriptional regulator [Candidatus Zixiibacteriota bacterium]